jgi:general nucleoside transport system ATP-binding protein
MSEASSGTRVVLALHGVDKRFGAVRANQGASLEVRAGEVYALVGENGAGKSTLMRIAAGRVAPDAGRVEFEGRDVTGWSTRDAIAGGIGMVHQHFMLVSTMTVAENAVLGREPRRGPSLDRARAVREVEAVARDVGFSLDARRKVRDLSVGEAQRVEIVKALLTGARLLILDEPTAVLSPPEVGELWGVLRKLRANGTTVVIITHKLDEVMQISDRVTVMRRGQTVLSLETGATTPAELARAMVDRNVVLSGEPSPESAPPAPAERAALELREVIVAGASRARAVDGVSLSVSPGEILGIAGVSGNGQSELVEAIAGLRAIASGSIALDGRRIDGLGVRARSDAGLAHIPEDRQACGLVLDFSVADNLILGAQHHFGGRFGLDREKIAQNARDKIAAFDVRPADPDLPARALSGGNQQKVVVAREMGGAYRVLLAVEPTRGVDVGAIEFIHGELRAARERGRAVLLVSSELSEVLALSDRIAVMYGGKIVATMPRGEASEQSLGPLMTGAASAA